MADEMLRSRRARAGGAPAGNGPREEVGADQKTTAKMMVAKVAMMQKKATVTLALALAEKCMYSSE